jgi:TrmH family RNA methyltransferase
MNVEVVVVDLKYPMNIGSVARTMSCMGFSKLSLVRPCKAWNSSMDAVKYSLFGKDILDSAKVFDDLNELKNKNSILLGFSRRIGRRRSCPVMLTELWDFMQKFGGKKNIKLVFGGESAGLSTDDLRLCDHIVTIDKAIVNNSLSLPSAVVAGLYEVRRMQAVSKKSKENPKDTDSGEAGTLLERVRDLLLNSGFIDNKDEKRVVPRLGGILKRLTLGEVRLIHSITKIFKGDDRK